MYQLKNKTNPSDKSTTFYCFSPPVMILTFVIEIVLMVYVFFRHRLSPVTILAGLILFFLAVFQLSEFGICQEVGCSNGSWAKIGFIAITMLPVLGLHLVTAIAGKHQRVLVSVAYITAALWIALFAVTDAFERISCQGNYNIFKLDYQIDGFYFGYYYLWLFVAMVLAVYYASKSLHTTTRRSLYSMVVGYLLFIVPTLVVYFVSPGTNGLPSIMCGFAVLFAVVLSFVVVPNALKGLRSG